MAESKIENGKQALVIVAHPDDESIWMGGFILKHPKLHWTILSLCRGSDQDRAPKFKKVCDSLDAKPIIEDMDDEGNLSFEQTVKEAKKLILKNTKNRKIDYIFSHGENGEYGHEAHCAVHQAIKELVKEKSLATEKIFYFNYKKSTNRNFPIKAKINSDLKLLMTPAEFTKKKNLMIAIYGFEPDGIDTKYCTNPEAFKIN